MAVCVRKMGGVPLDDILPKKREFRNADYWFEAQLVVGELKCLQADWANDFSTYAPKMFAEWVKSGALPMPPTPRVFTRDLPIEYARRIVEPLRRRLQTGIVQHASKQIKQTKDFLKAPHAKGLLMLANDGNLLLDPDTLNALLGNVLNRPSYSSINSVVFFSVNETLAIPGGAHGPFWMDFVFQGREPVERAFLDTLADAWCAHVSTCRPGPVVQVTLQSSLAAVDGLKMTGATGST